MKYQHLPILIILALLVGACSRYGINLPAGPDSGDDPSDPVSSDPGKAPTGESSSPLEPLENEEAMVRGEVFIDGVDVLQLESFPVQLTLHLVGNLPTPCHRLRANLTGPDQVGNVNVEVFSLSNPDEICIQMLEAFDATIPLGSFTSGTFTILVNGEVAWEVKL